MEGEFRSELVLPNEAGALGLARAYVRELATQGDLPGEAVEALATAIEGVCREVIERGFEPGERATFRLVGTLTAAVLGLAIHERGLPFDPSAPGAGGDARRGLAAGATWDLLRQTVDHAHWLNHGKAGMELRLLKHRPQGDIAEHLPAAALTPYRADEPLAHQQDYTIRRMRPDEAIQVAQCVYRAYGYSYGNADFYYPERIAHENVTGRLVSVVAVDAAGAVVWHLALERPEPRPVAESGAAVVAPAHRGRHLLERMRGFLEEEAARLGLLGVFGEPVTSHTYSQRMEEDFGAHACGVLLGGMPRSTRFNHIRAEPLGQRESNLLYFKYLAAPPPSTVYAPAQHRALLERIYGNLGTPVEYGAPAGGQPVRPRARRLRRRRARAREPPGDRRRSAALAPAALPYSKPENSSSRVSWRGVRPSRCDQRAIASSVRALAWTPIGQGGPPKKARSSSSRARAQARLTMAGSPSRAKARSCASRKAASSAAARPGSARSTSARTTTRCMIGKIPVRAYDARSAALKSGNRRRTRGSPRSQAPMVWGIIIASISPASSKSSSERPAGAASNRKRLGPPAMVSGRSVTHCTD